MARSAVLGRLLGVLVLGVAAHGQAIPEAADTMRCFGEVEQFVRSWGAADGEAAAIVDPKGAVGAAVTLRFAGQVIGRGSSLDPAGGNVRRALGEAWEEAARELVLERDALFVERRRAVSARIKVDLEVAGELQPLVGATFGAASARLSPGLDGVAIRLGERIAGLFPGFQLSMGLTPDRAWRVAAGTLELPPVELDRIRRDHEVVLYSFRTQHIAQPRAGDPPTFLQRGGRYVPLADMTASRLRAIACGIVAHLATHVWGGDGAYGLRGDHEPMTGRYEPMIGPPRSQALTAFALARYATSPGSNSEEAHRAVDLALMILHALTVVEPDELDPTGSPAAAALWLIAWAELSGVDGVAIPEGFRAFVHPTLDAISGVQRKPAQWNALAPGARALIAYAFVRTARILERPDLERRAREIVREIFLETNSAQVASAMPWLGWAELELAVEEIPAGIALRAFRDLAWKFQVEESPAQTPDADLSGGIVFARGGAARPTWQTLRPLAFLATMLGHPELTDNDELGAELATLRRSLRFVAQLTIRDAELHMVRSDRRSVGGVRHSLWDQTQGLDANALGLLTISEVLRAVAARSESPPEPDTP